MVLVFCKLSGLRKQDKMSTYTCVCKTIVPNGNKSIHESSKEHKSFLFLDNEKKIFARGFPPNARKQDVKTTFSHFGKCEISKFNKGNAVVTFENVNAARKAVSENGRVYFLNKKIFIRKYVITNHLPTTQKQDYKFHLNTITSAGDFDDQIQALLSKIRLTEAEVLEMGKFIEDFTRALRRAWPGCEVIPFGSIVTGLGVKGSDVDCLVKISSTLPSHEKCSQYVNQTKRLLLSYKVNNGFCPFQNVITIPHARVPIVKFYHTTTKTFCDANFTSMGGIENSKLIRFWLSLDDRILPMIVFIKFWAKTHDMCGVKGFTNYCLGMMVFFYLQQNPNPVIPTLVSLQKYCNLTVIDNWEFGFNPDIDSGFAKMYNPLSIKDLIIGFFRFYVDFDFVNLVVCPFTGESISKEHFLKSEYLSNVYHKYKANVRASNNPKNYLNVQSPICIQDPFEHSSNLAKNVTGKLYNNIINQLKNAEFKCRNCSNDDLLIKYLLT